MDEDYYTGQTYPNENEGLDHTALNFLKGEDCFRGYVPHGGNRITLESISRTATGDSLEDVLVVFVARPGPNSEAEIVGFYNNATVFRNPQSDRKLNKLFGATHHYYFESENAVLIPEEERSFKIPEIPDGRILGKRNTWYGLNKCSDWWEKRPKSHERVNQFHEDLLAYVSETSKKFAVTETETRSAKASHRYEGRAPRIEILRERGYQCEACGWKVKKKHREMWASGLDVHHTIPYAEIEEGERRPYSADEFRVLCSPCHRAIHKFDDLSDLNAISTDSGRPNQ